MPRDRSLTLALGIVALSVFISPFTRELFVGDETKYSQVVREIRAGAFFLPTLEGTPFTHKPPLHFWMIDAFTHVFGLYSMWSFALPAIIGFIFLLWLMWRMEGPLAALVCGTSVMVWGSAQSARMDVTFTAMTVTAAWMLQRSLDDGDRRALIIAGVAVGIATLIKGPMAPVIAIFLFAFEWIRRKRLPRGNYALAIAAMIVIPLLWFVPAMLQGGHSYTREVLVKQTAGRAIGAWVHRSPIWFYLAHAPADLFPWFLVAVIAIIAAYRRADSRAKFYVSWVLAVLIPYSLMSSKLDVYMMAMIPPVALLIARLDAQDDQWAQRGRIANLVMLVLLLIIGAVAPFFAIRNVEVAAIVALPGVKSLFVTLAVTALIGIMLSIRSRNFMTSAISVGLVPLAMLVYAALFLMPLANEMTSDRPIVRALSAQKVAPEEIALYSAPHLWTRDMPRQLERVRYASPQSLRERPATVIVTSRRHADEIEDVLRGYRKVDQFRMIGKWFDVYRR